MSNDYLWDRSGEPDAEIAKLESLLAPLAHYEKHPVRQRWRPAAIAAGMLVAAGGGWLLLRAPAGRATAWELENREAVRQGQVIRSEGSTLTLQADNVGRVEVTPGSVVRMIASGAEGHRLQLERGTLHALIWAPPKLFIVDTPSARAVDLGCQYTLSANQDGTGLLRVETGWVSLEHGGLQVFVPAGAVCRTRPKRAPGVPVFEDAGEAFQLGIAEFERTGSATALNQVLSNARARDAITLWHLLRRVRTPDRGAVFDRFSGLVPVAVRKEAVVALDQKALDACWNALGFAAW